MKFDISRVYTAVNAGKLCVGDKVIVADTVKDLKENVNTFLGDCLTLTEIGDEDEERRFYENETHSIPSSWALAYLVERGTREPCGIKE